MIPAHRNRILALSVLLACVLRSGHAQHTQEAGMLLNQLYPGPLGDADFGKIISGEFTGDLKRDVVVMDEMQPKLCVAPETFDSAIAVGPPANDIATQSGIVAGKDVILTAGPAGLVRFERDSFNATWIITTLRGTTSNWAGAQKVAVGELDGAGAQDIVGIGANGRDVLIEYGNLDGTYTPGTTFQAFGQVATDLWLLNWRDTGDVLGTDEIAINSPQGIEIREENAAFVEGINGVAPILGTVINDKDTLIQRLACVTTDAGVERLFVYGDTHTDGWTSLGNPGVVSLASADADHDGDSELFLNVNTENKFWRLTNRSPLPTTFLLSSVIKYHFGPEDRNPYLNEAWLAPGDFDSDGELDIVAPAQGDHGSPPFCVGSLAFVNVGDSDVARWRAGVSRVAYVTSDPPVIELRLTRPDEALPAPAGAQTRLRVKVFHALDVGIGTDAPPYAIGYASMPGAGPGQYSEFTFPLPPGFSLESSTNLFSLVVRQTVVSTSDGSILDIAPAMTGIYTADPNTPVVQQTPNTLEWMPTIEIPSSNPTFGGLDIGPTVPSMDPDVEPRDHDTP